MANPKSYRDRRNPSAAEHDLDLDTETDAPSFRTNAYPENEYEANRRLPTQRVYDYQTNEFSDRKDPLSDRVKNQVLSSLGERSGSMTFSSQLDRSRGVGTNDRCEAIGYSTPADGRGSRQIKKGDKL